MKAGQPMHDALRSIELFSGLEQDVFEALKSLCTFRSAEAGETIIGHMDNSSDVLFLLKGTARVSIYSPDGKRVGFRDIAPGVVFGELSAIDGEPRSASIEAIERCEIAAMARTALLRTFAEHPAFGLAIAQHLTRLVRSLTDRVFEFSTMAARNRLRMELLRLAEKAQSTSGAVELAPPPAHADLASRISSQREAVTREFTWLSQHGYIEKRDRTLVICDIARLRALIDKDWEE